MTIDNSLVKKTRGKIINEIPSIHITSLLNKPGSELIKGES